MLKFFWLIGLFDFVLSGCFLSVFSFWVLVRLWYVLIILLRFLFNFLLDGSLLGLYVLKINEDL